MEQIWPTKQKNQNMTHCQEEKIMKKITKASIAVMVIASAIGSITHQQIQINELKANVSSLETQNTELSAEINKQQKEIHKNMDTICILDDNLGTLTRSYGYGTLNSSSYPYRVEGCDLLKNISFKKPFDMVGSTDGNMYMVVETGESYAVCEVVDGIVEFNFDTHSQAYKDLPFNQVISCTIFSKEKPDTPYKIINGKCYPMNWCQYGNIWLCDDAISWTAVEEHNVVKFSNTASWT